MKISKELKIGIYFTLMIVALVWGVNFLKGMDIFGKVNKFYAVYENVEGLQTTNPVYIKGMKVGTVTKIKLEQKQKKFVVELQIKSDYKIPEKSIAYLYSADIMGTRAIKIKMIDSPEFLKSGDQISAAIEEDMLSLLSEDLPSIKDGLKGALNEIDTTFKNINSLLSEKTINSLSNAISSLEGTMRNIESLSVTLNKGKGNITASLENLDSITTNFKGNSQNINNILDNFSALSDTLKSIQITQTIDKVNTLLNKINSGTGTAGKLIYNDALYDELSTSLSNLEALLADIKENPKRYINISVFGGRKKDK